MKALADGACALMLTTLDIDARPLIERHAGPQGVGNAYTMWIRWGPKRIAAEPSIPWGIPAIGTHLAGVNLLHLDFDLAAV